MTTFAPDYRRRDFTLSSRLPRSTFKKWVAANNKRSRMRMRYSSNPLFRKAREVRGPNGVHVLWVQAGDLSAMHSAYRRRKRGWR